MYKTVETQTDFSTSNIVEIQKQKLNIKKCQKSYLRIQIYLYPVHQNFHYTEELSLTPQAHKLPNIFTNRPVKNSPLYKIKHK